MKLKKWLAGLLAFVMVLTMLPREAFAAGTDDLGSVQEITKYGTVDGSNITVAGSTLDWVASDPKIGRYQDGWWIGVKIIAPESVTSENVKNVKYSNNGSESPDLNFADSKDGIEDGKYWMGCWVPIKPEYLEGALAAGSNLKWQYKFDWSGDGKVDQTFKITVDPKNITLNKDGKVWCKTENGVMTVKEGKGTLGSVQEITKYGTVDGSNITVAGSTLEWAPKDTSIGRYQEGWWIGVKIIAPEFVDTDQEASKVTYSNDGTDKLVKNFGTNKDGKWWMGCWVPITPEYLEKALAAGSNLQWQYKFDWSGDGKVDQTFTITVDPKNITLNKDGDVWCKTEDGVMTVKDGQEVHYHSYGKDWKYDETEHWHECACDEKEDKASHTMEWVIDKVSTATEKGSKHEECSVCGYKGAAVEIPVTETDVETKIVQTELTKVPEGLAGTKFNSVEAIKTALINIASKHIECKEENTVVKDVKLQISPDGAGNWIDATEENFPAEGITIVLPYPEGTGKDTHNFVVTHMFSSTSARLGTRAGDIETPEVTKLDNGIQVTLKGFSPVLISWEKVSASVEKPGSSNTVSKPEGNSNKVSSSAGKKVSSSAVPKTGDNSNMTLWFALMMASVLCIGATLLYGRKRKENR